MNTLVVRFGYHATFFALDLERDGTVVEAVGKWESPEAISKERGKPGIGFPRLRLFHGPPREARSESKQCHPDVGGWSLSVLPGCGASASCRVAAMDREW